MASVCGGSLSLMDAGVPVKDSVAGIAMGLIKEGDEFAVLSDILGDEGPTWGHGFQGDRQQEQHHCPSNGHQDRWSQQGGALHGP